MSETEYRLGTPHIDQDHRIRLQNPLMLVAPVIAGTVTVSGVLTVTDPELRVGAVTDTLLYQWYRNGLPIDGETASTYTVVAADVDQRIRCLVWVVYAGFTKKWFSNALVGEA